MITLRGERKMTTALRAGRVSLAAVSLVIAFTIVEALRAQSPTFSITLTGQSMIRSDIRAHAPSAVPIITSLLKGDVIFTNFEATILDEKKGQSPRDGRFLSPPDALDALQSFGFNLISLSNNHSFDLKVAGIQNALEEASRLKLAHAGTGNTIDEAVAPGYLKTPKGTVALVAMASGLIPEGGSATPTRPGHCLSAQPRLRQTISNHHARRIAGTARPARLAQEMDSCRSRRRRGHHRDAWCADAA